MTAGLVGFATTNAIAMSAFVLLRFQCLPKHYASANFIVGKELVIDSKLCLTVLIVYMYRCIYYYIFLGSHIQENDVNESGNNHGM
jgi:hypothetical protein